MPEYHFRFFTVKGRLQSMHETTNEEAYAESLYAPDEALEQVKKSIRQLGLQDISVAAGYGRLLTLLVRASRSQHVLEIGAFGGYSGICLARGLDEDGRLISLELKQELANLALANMTHAGFGKRVEYRVGEAIAQLERLSGEARRFDFTFIDADKGNYPVYLEWAIRLSNPGALIVADNTFLRGRTLDPNRNGSSVLQVRHFNEQIATDPRLESTMLPAYDGLAVARVK